MRRLTAAILILIGCAAALLAWGALRNLFGYQDSPAWVYLLFGIPLLLLAAGAFVAAWRLIRR